MGSHATQEDSTQNFHKFPNPIVNLDFHMKTAPVESVEDFLIKLDMKPCMHIVETSSFSLKHVIVRLTKIMNNLLWHLKIRAFKVIFLRQKLVESVRKKIYEEYLTRRSTFIKTSFLKILIFKILYFLRLCPIFVGSVHNFGKSDNDKT